MKQHRKDQTEVRRRYFQEHPLYRTGMWGLMAASVVQLVTQELPPSIRDGSPSWFDKWYAFGSPLGAALILFALLTKLKIYTSLQIERIGCILTCLFGISYILAVAINNEGLPQAQSSWLTVVFSLYCGYRIFYITELLGANLPAPLRALFDKFKGRGAPS